MTEPSIQKKTKDSCPYCGDAPLNHRLSYIESLFSVPFESYTLRIVNNAPQFIKDIADRIPPLLFKICLSVGLGELSSDIDKALSFRSRIIWEEANKRGIPMQQIILFGKPLDYYRASMHGKVIYFESLPVPDDSLDMKKNWDDKTVLKEELVKNGIPVPLYRKLPIIRSYKDDAIFSSFTTPVIIKPRVGSRARHTITYITTLGQFHDAIKIANQISACLVVEEHLVGFVSRATVVDGTLAGFYQGKPPQIMGDGHATIRELIEKKNETRADRVGPVCIETTLSEHLSRLGYTLDDILPEKETISLSHHNGRLIGGTTKEMIDELHPSFIPILEHAARVVGLSVVGFDCIIPDPTKDASSQKWGIIECNTLPFIDLHYYALEGKPRNIAGMVWDMWG
jgi:cyanophycin synthetase